MARLTLKHPDDWSSSWRNFAACRGIARKQGTFHEFFPGQGENPVSARKLCATCPVSVRCLDFALLNNIRDGIWGGKGERQRRAIRRNWNKQQAVFLLEMAPALDDVSMTLADG